MFKDKLNDIEKPLKEESVYEDEGREELVNSDAMEPEEEGFMQGYDSDETVLCGFCRKPIINPEETMEKIMNNKIHRFCSESCLLEFEEDVK